MTAPSNESSSDKHTPLQIRPPRILCNTGAWSPLVDTTAIYAGNRGFNRDDLFTPFDAPVGIRFEVESALKSEPLLEAVKAWERPGIAPLYIWQDDGAYHMLYESGGNGAAYARSDDAYRWTRPELGQVEFQGSRQNNLIANPPRGSSGFFEDPQAPPSERYKAMGGNMAWYDPDTNEKLIGDEAGKRIAAQNAEGVAYKGPKAVIWGWMLGWTSPDRFRWTPLEQPLGNRPVNGAIAARFDPHHKDYYAYLQIMGYPTEVLGGIGTGRLEESTHRRTIGFARTDDFRTWPAPKLILEPDAQDDLDISFYGANYFPYPGRTDLHGMLIPIYHQITDHMDGQIAFSRDGLFWSRPERKPIIEVGAPGSGDECSVHFWRGGLIELPDGNWASPYTGNSKLHNVPFNIAGAMFPAHRPLQIRWARWQPHRFCGLVAALEGRFTIPTAYRCHDELRLNYRCQPGGWIKVELLEKTPHLMTPDGDPVPGFSFAECDLLTGDAIDHVVTWKGRRDISGIGETVAIRIEMFQAKLFAYRV